MTIGRRGFVLAAAGAALVGGGGWLLAQRGPDYEAEAEALWSRRPSAADELAYLVHYATLAANSHNAQPWRFGATADGVAIASDLGRALPVADADNHHLYASLGCAAENLMLAATAEGRAAAIHFAEGDDGAGGAGRVEIALAHGGATRDPLFDAIVARQCTRSDFDGQPVSAADLAMLARAARVEGCELVLIDERSRIEQVLELILAANTAQVSDPAFRAELRSWLRFNAREAVAQGDGLYSACSGNPSLPSWLGPQVFDLVFKPDAENARYARQVRSSAGLAVFVSARDDPAHWVQAGRSYQRFALQATALGIRHAHLNQAVEVAAIRPQLAALLGVRDGRVDLVVRYGRAPAMPRSLRRPVDEVLQRG